MKDSSGDTEHASSGSNIRCMLKLKQNVILYTDVSFIRSIVFKIYSIMWKIVIFNVYYSVCFMFGLTFVVFINNKKL